MDRARRAGRARRRARSSGWSSSATPICRCRRRCRRRRPSCSSARRRFAHRSRRASRPTTGASSSRSRRCRRAACCTPTAAGTACIQVPSLGSEEDLVVALVERAACSRIRDTSSTFRASRFSSSACCRRATRSPTASAACCGTSIADRRPCVMRRRTPGRAAHPAVLLSRRRRSWGIGDIGDLAAVDGVAGRRPDSACCSCCRSTRWRRAQQSPYSAISAMAIDPIYISVAAVPEFAAPAASVAVDATTRALLGARPAVAARSTTPASGG